MIAWQPLRLRSTLLFTRLYLQACNIAYTVHTFIFYVLLLAEQTMTMPRSDRWLQGMWSICSRLMFSKFCNVFPARSQAFEESLQLSWRALPSVEAVELSRSFSKKLRTIPNTYHGFTLHWSDTGDKIRPGMQTLRCSFPRKQVWLWRIILLVLPAIHPSVHPSSKSIHLDNALLWGACFFSSFSLCDAHEIPLLVMEFCLSMGWMRDLPWRHCSNLDRWVHLHYRHRTWKGHRFAVPLILLQPSILQFRLLKKYEKIDVVKDTTIRSQGCNSKDRPYCWPQWQTNVLLGGLPAAATLHLRASGSEWRCGFHDCCTGTVGSQYELEALLKFWNNLSKRVPKMFVALFSLTPFCLCSLGFQLFGSPCRICVKQKQVCKDFYIRHAKRASWTGSELRNKRAWSMKTVLASPGPTYVIPFASLPFQGRTSVTSRMLTCFWGHYTAAFKAMPQGSELPYQHLSTIYWHLNNLLATSCVRACFPTSGFDPKPDCQKRVWAILLCIVRHWHFKSVSGAWVCTVGCVHFGNPVPGTIPCAAQTNA